jgi:hypothetical protein
MANIKPKPIKPSNPAKRYSPPFVTPKPGKSSKATGKATIVTTGKKIKKGM